MALTAVIRVGAALVVLVAPAVSSAQSTLALRPERPVVRDSTDAVARFGQLLAAINTVDINTRRFLAISGLRPAQVSFVDVRNILRGDMTMAYEQAVGRQERRITAMRNTLQSSFILRDALVARDIPMSHVVAVDVAPDASRATVYYRPPGS